LNRIGIRCSVYDRVPVTATVVPLIRIKPLLADGLRTNRMMKG
jgi:hypothetical protein